MGYTHVSQLTATKVSDLCLLDDEILQRISALAFEGLNGWSTDLYTAKNTSLRTEVSNNTLQCEKSLFPQKTGFFSSTGPNR